MSGPEWPGPLLRLGQFRARNPGVVIGRDALFGFWQAWIPVANGGTVITRYVLQDLLDKLEELLGPERAHSAADPAATSPDAGPAADHQDPAR